MDTSALTAFVTAAEAGSLTRAAERLGAQISTVSRRIADLEAALGAALFQRTGRGVRLTPSGERVLERARRVLGELELAAAEVRGDPTPDLTVLRLSSPPDLSRQLLPTVLCELVTRHPGLSIEARAEVRRVSLVEESYDAVVRLGRLSPSDLIARKLGSVTMVACARPGSAITSPRELAGREHVLVVGTPSELGGIYRRRRTRIRLTGAIHTSSFLEAAEVAARSERPAILPSFVAVPMIAAGRLERAAPALALPSVPLHLLRTPKHRASAVIRDLGDLLSAALETVERAVAGSAAVS